MPVNIEDGVKSFIKLRDLKSARQKAFDEQLKPVNDALEKLENWLINQLNTLGAEHVATECGTVYKVTRSSASVKDWDEAFLFIQEHALWHFLEHRVNKTALEEFIKENKQQVPGVEIHSIIKVNVRR